MVFELFVILGEKQLQNIIFEIPSKGSPDNIDEINKNYI